MGSICFSSASILRCTPLTSLQNILLIVPTALEVIFSTSLIFINWHGSKRHLLLTAEGWVYLTLSVIELLRAVVPGVRDNVSLFRALDTGIGVASFIPIFFYTFFLFLFTSNDLADILPKGIKNVAKLSLILFVPAVIILNEIASFFGVTVGDANRNSPHLPIFVTVGFANTRDESLWSFFTSTTLALLVGYQAAVFCFAFFRLSRAIVGQRRIEKEDSDKAHFVNGIGWLCGALKLGALESVVGFAGGSFGIALTRRIMRLLARACLTIGIVQGVDSVEDFRDVQQELRINTDVNNRKKKNALRQLISNPRFSTFRQLSPTATSFHANTRGNTISAKFMKDEPELAKGPHYATWTQRQSKMIQHGLPGMQTFADIKEAREKRHVTVLYEGGTPKLHMRFSVLDVPTPAFITEKIRSRSQSEAISNYLGRTHVQLTRGSDNGYSDKESELQAPAPHFHKEYTGSESYRDSINSAPSFEIIDARKFSQTVAKAKVYQTSNVDAPEASIIHIEDIPLPEPTYRMSSPPTDRQSQVVDASRVKSMVSVKSVADSIQAVRELTSQFPGPPGISQIRPAEYERRLLPTNPAPQVYRPTSPIIERSVWEEDSRTSAQYLSGLPEPPKVIGSPSQFQFNNDPHNQRISVEDESDIYVGIQCSEVSPIRAGKVAVKSGYSRMSTTSSRYKSRQSLVQKVIDPSDDGDSDDLKPTKTPIVVPVGTPLRQSLRTAAAPIQQQSKGSVQPLTATYAETTTPTTALSELTRIQDTVIDGRVDPFLNFATALDTGKSRQFRPSLPPLPEPLPQRRMSTIPTTPSRKMSKTEEKLSRIAEWVDTSANVAMAEAQANPILPGTPVSIATPTIMESPVDIQFAGRTRENNLQNLHDRGPSIDALSIPWPKPTISEEEARRFGSAVSVQTSAMRPQLTRITTVGKAPSRTTPVPMRSMHMRGSMYLQPIVVPPRDGSKLPEVVQIEYETTESPVNRNALGDSDILEIEESLRPPQRLTRF